MQVTLDTPLETYLQLCEERGANEDGDCKSFTWARAAFGEEATLQEGLGDLLESPVGFEASMFAFENMLDVLSAPVRVQFARVLANHPSHVVHALSWRRLVAVHKPTMLEDWLLRSAWHSSWRGQTTMPNWEALG